MAETEAETMEDAASGLLHELPILLSYTQDHLPRGSTTHSVLGPLPTSIINQQNALEACGKPDGGIFSTEALFPRLLSLMSSGQKNNQEKDAR